MINERAATQTSPIGSQRGFTIIELLVAMAVAGILISLIFAVYTRMSVAYQAQNRVTSVIQNLRAGQDRLIRELRMAGGQVPAPNYRPLAGGTPGSSFAPTNAVPETAVMFDGTVDWNGIKAGSGVGFPGHTNGTPIQPVYVTNGGGAVPDQFRFFYADQGVSGKVDAITLGTDNHIDLEDHDPLDSRWSAADFAPGDLILLVNTTQEPISMDVDTTKPGVETFEVTGYEACMLRVSGTVAGGGSNRVSASMTVHPFFNGYTGGATPPSHCSDVLAQHNADIARPAAARSDTMLYKLIARSYRIDPSRPSMGVLQYHRYGELVPGEPWTDLGVGFTNLQVATQWIDESAGAVDKDADGSAIYNWFSGENQEFPDPSLTNPRANTAVMVRMTVSLEARSFAEVDTPSSQLAGFLQGANADHNPVGDSPPLTVPNLDPRYLGTHVYRWLTMNFEFRNMGRGY